MKNSTINLMQIDIGGRIYGVQNDNYQELEKRLGWGFRCRGEEKGKESKKIIQKTVTVSTSKGSSKSL